MIKASHKVQLVDVLHLDGGDVQRRRENNDQKPDIRTALPQHRAQLRKHNVKGLSLHGQPDRNDVRHGLPLERPIDCSRERGAALGARGAMWMDMRPRQSAGR